MILRVSRVVFAACVGFGPGLSGQEKKAEIQAAPVERRVERLANGMTLVHLPKSRLPLTTFALFLGHGAADEPVGRRGMTRFVLDLTWTGQGALSEEEVLLKIGDMGGEYGVDVQVEYSRVWFSCLRSHAREGLSLFETALREPSLPWATVEREKDRLSALVAWRRNEPYYMASDAFYKTLLGEHAYGRAMSSAKKHELEDLEPDELRAFLGELRRPSDAVLFVMGPCEEVLWKDVRSKFGAWQAVETARRDVLAPVSREDSLNFRTVVRPDSKQIYLRFGAMGPAANSPERAAHEVFTRAIAGGFTSVLVDELRVNRGLIYGVSLMQDWLSKPSPFSLVMSTQAANTGEVLKLTFAKLREVRAGKLEAEVFEAAQNTLLRSLAQAVVKPELLARAEYLGWRNHGDFDTWHKQIDAVRAVTKAEVLAVAKCYDPSVFTVVMVGSRENLAAVPSASLR